MRSGSDSEESTQDHQHGAKRQAPAERLVKEHHREHQDERERELVDGRNPCGVADLQRAEITYPRYAGRKAGKHEEDPRFRRRSLRKWPLAPQTLQITAPRIARKERDFSRGLLRHEDVSTDWHPPQKIASRRLQRELQCLAAVYGNAQKSLMAHLCA